MKSIKLALLCLLQYFIVQVNAQTTFENYFTLESLRYDFELIGNSQTTQVIHVQSKQLPRWAGNPGNLIDEMNYGTHRFILKALNTNEIIFSQGFSPLFMEYQTTVEAKTKARSYYQAVFFPKPKTNVLLSIETRSKSNKWTVLFTDTIKTTDYFILNEHPKTFPTEKIVFSGEPSHKIDVLILSEGYTKKEMKKFIADSKRLTDSLFAASPFNKYRDKFNITAIKVPSEESGTDIPGKAIYKNTAFNSHFYTFDSERYLTTSDMKSIYDVLDAYPFDQIYVLVNTEKYGGGGFYNFMNLCSSDNEKSPFVFIHEFGHGFAGLGDEYYTSSTSYEEFYAYDTEPWEPNLTTLIDFNSKWKGMLSPTTPLPTPRNEQYQNVVGVYEGGGYSAKGIYSPMMTCWMKEQKAGKFCPVCTKAIEEAIRINTK
jgi:hypothetical protein